MNAIRQIRDFVDSLGRAWGSGASQDKQHRKKKRPGVDGRHKRPDDDLAWPVDYRTRLTTWGVQSAAKPEIRRHCA